ncbi:partial tRNA(Glu)-specific nuclease WapA, partial [Anaerolineae bacterium]
MTDASGLVYLRARYYVPELGVFPSLDPVEGALDHPPSLNRYGYVQQNPVNWTDPSGTCPEEVRAAGRAVAELVELAPGVDLGPDGELVFENAACAAYYGFAQVPLQVIDKARDIAKAAPILYGAKAAYEAARLATAAVGASTLVLGGAVVAIPVLMLIIAGGASIPSPYTEEMLETMRNRYP